MNIYHGNYYKIENPKIIAGKYTKDFGEGFYCTILKEQAIKWAKKFDTSVLNIYEYNENLTGLLVLLSTAAIMTLSSSKPFIFLPK